jgi:hypothetical protein
VDEDYQCHVEDDDLAIENFDLNKYEADFMMHVELLLGLLLYEPTTR